MSLSLGCSYRLGQEGSVAAAPPGKLYWCDIPESERHVDATLLGKTPPVWCTQTTPDMVYSSESLTDTVPTSGNLTGTVPRGENLTNTAPLGKS